MQWRKNFIAETIDCGSNAKSFKISKEILINLNTQQ